MGAPPWLAHASWVAAPSPIKGGGGDPSHHPISHSFLRPFGWHFSPLLVGPPLEELLRRSPAQKFSPPPPPCRSAAGVPEDPLLPLPNWRKGRRSSSNRTCDRVRRCCPFVALIFATLRSGVYTLHQPRLFAGTLSRLQSSRVSPSETVTSIS